MLVASACFFGRNWPRWFYPRLQGTFACSASWRGEKQPTFWKNWQRHSRIYFRLNLSKDKTGAIVWTGGHAPDEEGALGEEVGGEVVHHGVHRHLHQADQGQHHPVAEPGEVVLHVLGEDGLHRLHHGVDEAHAGPEHLPPLAWAWHPPSPPPH